MNEHTNDNANLTTHVTTCPVCREVSQMQVPAAGLRAWRSGVPVQTAFPTLGREVREQIKSGMHPECGARLFDPALLG